MAQDPGVQSAVFGKDVAQVLLAREMVENEARGTGLDLTWIPFKTGIGQELSPLEQKRVGKPGVH